jgi:hypothetical protein
MRSSKQRRLPRPTDGREKHTRRTAVVHVHSVVNTYLKPHESAIKPRHCVLGRENGVRRAWNGTGPGRGGGREKMFSAGRTVTRDFVAHGAGETAPGHPARHACAPPGSFDGAVTRLSRRAVRICDWLNSHAPATPSEWLNSTEYHHGAQAVR